VNTTSWKDRKIIQLLFWIGVVWFFYGFTLFFDFFVFDDGLHIWDNAITGVRTPNDLFYYWRFSLTPVIYFVWQLVSIVFSNQDPAPFRALNFVLMGGCSFLVFDLSRTYLKLISKGYHAFEYFLPFLAGLFFLLHPSQVESIVWVSSGRTLLATFFALLSLKSLSLVEEESDFSKYTFLTVVFFVLGVLSKPSIVTLPVLMAGLLYLKGKNIKQALSVLWPIILIGIVMGFLHISEVFTPYLKTLSYADRLIIVLDSISSYFKILYFPFIQSFDYARNPANVLSEWYANKWLFLISPSLILISIFSGLFTKRFKTWSLFMLGFYALLLPNMGFIYYDFQNISTVSSRYLHLPLVIVSFAIIPLGLFLIDKWKNYSIALACSTLGVFILMALINFNYARLWVNSLEVLSHSRSITGPTYPLSMSMGNLYMRSGKYKLAEKEFLEAWDLEPIDYGPFLALIELYQIYKFKGPIDNFLTKVRERGVFITPDKSFEIAKLYAEIDNYERARHFSNIAYKSNIEPEASKAFYLKSIEMLNRKKINHYLFVIKNFIELKKFKMAQDIYEVATLEFPNSRELLDLKNNLPSTNGEN